jgi:hypothetical protein
VLLKAADQAASGGKDARPLTTLAGARARPRLDYSDDAPQAASAGGGGAGSVACDVECGDVASLLWHESDTRVKSIVGNARIERVIPVRPPPPRLFEVIGSKLLCPAAHSVLQIKLDEAILPFAPLVGKWRTVPPLLFCDIQLRHSGRRSRRGVC